MSEMGIEKAVLGIRYLIKYANKPNQAYFSVIPDCVSEVKFWCLLTIFNNHLDDLWKNVPDFLYEDIFLMKKFETNRGFLDYGRGYFSNSSLTYREQFKNIRDNLAHHMFTYQEGMIYLNDGYKTHFDIKWLEQLVLTTILNDKNEFRKGMSDITTISFIPKAELETADFKKCFDNHWIFLCKVTLLTSNKNSMAKCFSYTNLPVEHFTFNLVYGAVKHLLFLQNFRCFSGSFEKLFQSIEHYFGGFVKLESLPFEQKDVEHLLEDEDFQKLSLQGQLKYYINHLKLKDPYYQNAIILLNLFDILDASTHDIYDPEKMIILKDAFPFLLKVYACILSSLYANQDYEVRLKEEIIEQFEIDVHFVHAKKVYKEYVKAITKCYEEVCYYGGGKEYQNRIFFLLQQYISLLDEALQDDASQRLFWNIRNAIIHNQIEFSDNQVRLYITGSDLHLKHFSNKKKEWVFKDFKNNDVIWEMIMDQDKFLALIDNLFLRKGVPVSINISKYVRKKNKV